MLIRPRISERLTIPRFNSQKPPVLNDQRRLTLHRARPYADCGRHLLLPLIFLFAATAADAALYGVGDSRGFSGRMASHLYRILLVGYFWLGATGAGLWLLRRASLRCDGALRILVAAALGFSIGKLFLFFLGSFGAYWPPLLVALPLLGMIGLRELLHKKQKSVASRTGETGDRDILIRMLLGAVLAIAAAPALIEGLTPPASWDALVYHLTIPRLYLEAGRLVALPDLLYANFPHASDLLYLLPLAAGEPIAANLLHFSFGGAALIGVACLGRRFGGWSAGLWAAALLATQPVFGFEWGKAYVDVEQAFCGVVMIVALEEYYIGKGRRWLWVAGFLAGQFMAAKYVGLWPVAAGAMLCLVWRKPVGALPQWRAATEFAFFALIPLLPWLIKNLIMTGNPVFPLLYAWLDGLGFSAGRYERLMDWQRNWIGGDRGFVSWLILPYSAFFRSGWDYAHFGGALWPAPLLFLPFIIERKKPYPWAWRSLVLFAITFYLWGLGARQTRFLLPALPWLALASAWSLAALRRRGAKKTYALVSLVGLVLLFFVLLSKNNPAADWLSTRGRLNWIVGKESDEDFLRARIATLGVFEELDRIAAPDDRVALIYTNLGFYCPRPYRADSMFESSLWLERAVMAGDGAKLSNEMAAEGFRYLIVDTGQRELIEQHIVAGRFDSETLNRADQKGKDVLSELIESSPLVYSDGAAELRRLTVEGDEATSGSLRR